MAFEGSLVVGVLIECEATRGEADGSPIQSVMLEYYDTSSLSSLRKHLTNRRLSTPSDVI